MDRDDRGVDESRPVASVLEGLPDPDFEALEAAFLGAAFLPELVPVGFWVGFLPLPESELLISRFPQRY